MYYTHLQCVWMTVFVLAPSTCYKSGHVRKLPGITGSIESCSVFSKRGYFLALEKTNDRRMNIEVII